MHYETTIKLIIESINEDYEKYKLGVINENELRGRLFQYNNVRYFEQFSEKLNEVRHDALSKMRDEEFSAFENILTKSALSRGYENGIQYLELLSMHRIDSSFLGAPQSFDFNDLVGTELSNNVIYQDTLLSFYNWTTQSSNGIGKGELLVLIYGDNVRKIIKSDGLSGDSLWNEGMSTKKIIDIKANDSQIDAGVGERGVSDKLFEDFLNLCTELGITYNWNEPKNGKRVNNPIRFSYGAFSECWLKLKDKNIEVFNEQLKNYIKGMASRMEEEKQQELFDVMSDVITERKIHMADEYWGRFMTTYTMTKNKQDAIIKFHEVNGKITVYVILSGEQKPENVVFVPVLKRGESNQGYADGAISIKIDTKVANTSNEVMSMFIGLY